jgi:hypothetical protein
MCQHAGLARAGRHQPRQARRGSPHSASLHAGYAG